MAKRAKLTDEQILTIVSNELSNANVTTSSPTALRDPLAYYLGLPNGEEIDGRSAITSTDVADAIEWIMPQVMKSFTQNNEVVIFDPVNAGDEKQAELESQYVYDVLMKKNNGFILIHQFVKDALMQRNGILKVYYEDVDNTITESYTGLSDVQLQMLIADKSVEVLQYSTDEAFDEIGNPIASYDVKISRTESSGKICIDPIPPEQFRVNSQHPSIDLTNARFTAQIINKTSSDLKEEGVSDTILEKLPPSDLIRAAYRFNMQNEPTLVPTTFPGDDSSALHEIGECYLKLDIDGTGISELQKVVTGGVQPASVIISVEPVEGNPWVTTTGILMSHKYQGLSIYDRIKEIQDNKTSLFRNIMDNIYLQNNQRMEVVTGQVNMDDLLVSRPGGLVRTKRLGSIAPIVTPPVGQAGMEMMNYLDQVRAGRVGVSPEGSASPTHVGDRVGSEGLDRMMNAKEELVGLIVRVICETGIKPLCIKIRNLLVKHFDTIEDYKFRGEWVQVNPAAWRPREECTVRVGTGTGDHRAQQVAIQGITAMQEKIMSMPGQALCNPTKVYAALDDLCKFSGLNGAAKYFIDPASPEGQQATQAAGQASKAAQQQAQQLQAEQLKQQAQLAQAAVITAEAQQKNVEVKGVADVMKHQHAVDKLNWEQQVSQLKDQLAKTELLLKTTQSNKQHSDSQDLAYDKLAADTALELIKIEAETKQNEVANYIATQNAVEDNDDSVETD